MTECLKNYLVTAMYEDGEAICEWVEAVNVLQAAEACDYQIDMIIAILYMSEVMVDQPRYA